MLKKNFFFNLRKKVSSKSYSTNSRSERSPQGSIGKCVLRTCMVVEMVKCLSQRCDSLSVGPQNQFKEPGVMACTGNADVGKVGGGVRDMA